MQQIEAYSATKLQAAIRGTLLRRQVARQRQIKKKREEALRLRMEDASAAKLVSHCRLPPLRGLLTVLCAVGQGHVAFLERVGMKPSESSGKEGGPLGSDSYSQIYAANKLQAAFRGKRGRALAAQKAAGLRNEYSEMMQTMQAATLVQRMWRQWRRRPPAMPVPEKEEDETEAPAAGDQPAKEEDAEEEEEDGGGANRTLDSLFTRQFPQFSELLQSHRQGEGMFQDDAGASCGAKVVADRLKRLDSMGVRLIWVTADLVTKAQASTAKKPNRWKSAHSKVGAIRGVLAAAKAETAAVEGAEGVKKSGRAKTEAKATGGDDGANKMACHFWKKGQPLVALKYLQKDAAANAAGFVDSEYKLAVNLANTACIFVTPPICNAARFDDAIRFTDRSIQTLDSHAETATLANCSAKAAIRRLELAVCVHNAAVHLVYAGRMPQALKILEEAHNSLADLSAELRKHAYAMAIKKTFAALDKVGSVLAPPPDVVEGAGEVPRTRGRGATVFQLKNAARLKRKAGKAKTRLAQGRPAADDGEPGPSAPPADLPAAAASGDGAATKSSIRFVVSEPGPAAPAPEQPLLRLPRLGPKPGATPVPESAGPVQRLRAKLKDAQLSASQSHEKVPAIQSVVIASAKADNLLSSMANLSRSMIANGR